MGDGAVALRSVLLRSLLAVTAVAVVVLALPLAWYVQTSNRAEVVAELEQEATRVVALVPEQSSTLPAPKNPDVGLGLYDDSGRLIAGTGPQRDSDASGALEEGSTRVKTEEGYLAVYVPFAREAGSRTTVRAVLPVSVYQSRTYRAWGVLFVACVIAFAIAAIVALRRSRQLALPFERIADAARELREGTFAIRVAPTGISEGDEVGRMLEEASMAAAERVSRERELAQDANHQVRTPVAAARLTLEAALTVPGSDLEQAATEAVAQLDRASAAIDDVLTLRRGDGEVRVAEAGSALHDAVERWRPVAQRAGRLLTDRLDDDALDVLVADGVLRQTLDVLLDNALHHGRGTVRLSAREAGGSLVVDVEDEGALPEAILASGPFTRGATTRQDGNAGGFGLPVARSLADSVGGRLVVASASPTRFTLLLNAEENRV